MQVQQLPIYQFLEGSGKSFVIPVYQRDYAWKKENCEKLWQDILDLNKNKRYDHFLGTIVSIGTGYQEYIIIDGQQRLTTISLFLLALHNHLKLKKEKTPEENSLAEQLLEFLINKYSSEKNKRIRLKPNKQDKNIFEKLFSDSSENLNVESNILNNYNFFLQKIEEKKLEPIELFETFRKLKIVLINLERGQDDPQLIFESLNSTGQDLTSGDLIRNYILMDLEPENQEKLYREYWVSIEKLTNNVAEFVRNYLIFRLRTWVKKGDVYPIFKNYARDKFGDNKEKIIEELHSYAKLYSYLICETEYSNIKVLGALKSLKRIEFTVCYPYLFDVFDDLLNERLFHSQVVNILSLIESYAFRKIIVDNTTQGLNKMFITLARDIKKESDYEEKYLDILNYILIEKRVSQRFPTNEEFENALINKEVYKLQSKNRNFLLESIENKNSAYPINIEDLSIEHIMPQKLTPKWKKALGDNWQEVHNKFIHTLGNLSLTAKNSELSNLSLERKQEIDYQTSRLNLNYKLGDIESWNENSIVQRAKILTKKAIEIWQYPSTDYTKPIPQEQLFDLSSEDDFSGQKLSLLILGNDDKNISIRHWRELLREVCTHLYNSSPTTFLEAIKKTSVNLSFKSKDELKSPVEYTANKYVEGNRSANDIILILKNLCEELNYPLENVSFVLKENHL